MHVFYYVIKLHTRVAVCSFELMLDRYLGECMVSIINVNIGIKEHTDWYQKFDTSQMLIFGEKIFVYRGYYFGEYHYKLY